MQRVGFVGWRGMVGSVLLERMLEENDFDHLDPIFFSTSQIGENGPKIGKDVPGLMDAFDLKMLSGMDVIVSCQGGDYTSKVYPEIRNAGWNGIWIDAASTLRMQSDSIIVLDPVNREAIEAGLRAGVKNYIGGNCTVSLMLMALAGLFEQDLIEWMTSMTYQAASGAGANNMREMVAQMARIGQRAEALLADAHTAILEIDRNVTDSLKSRDLPCAYFQVPLAASLIPWIDREMDCGQTREEWKGMAETNKILGRENNPVAVDGICVRIAAMRCHSQAFTLKLRKDVPVVELEQIIAEQNPWVKVIPNTKEDTLRELTPAKVSGTLDVPVGRVRKLNMGSKYLTAFSVGDQLLWGAAEPLRRVLRIILEM